MWSLRQKENNEFYLTFDKYRRYTIALRGIWEYLGQDGNVHTDHQVRINRAAGLLCAKDDEGGVRVLVLEE